MMKVKFELCPGGIDDPETNELLGEMIIANQILETVRSSGKRVITKSRFSRSDIVCGDASGFGTFHVSLIIPGNLSGGHSIEPQS
jgi:hypothetical protein